MGIKDGGLTIVEHHQARQVGLSQHGERASSQGLVEGGVSRAATGRISSVQTQERMPGTTVPDRQSIEHTPRLWSCGTEDNSNGRSGLLSNLQGTARAPSKRNEIRNDELEDS